MKKTCSVLFLLALLLSLPLLLSSCEKETREVKTLHVYNWGQYISDGSYDLADTNELFVTYFNENLAEKYGYEIELNYSTYASNEDMYNKISSGSGSYDVIIPSDYMIEQMIHEELLLPLDYGKISNFSYIDDKFKTEYNTYDPESRYSVPYTFGLIGVIYNTDYVDESDTGSWDLLWNSKYEGKILQFNNSRDAMATAMYRLGYSVNTTDHAKWREANNLLLQQKPLVQAYVMDEIFNKMISSSSWIAPYYAGDFLTCYDSNDSLAFYLPREGTNFFVDAMCIPTCAKNVDVAHEYINFMLSEEPAVANAMYIGYASPNTLVRENEDYIAYMSDWHEDALDILYGEDMALYTYDDLGDIEHEGLKVAPYRAITNTEENGNLLDLTNALWSEMKIESSIEPWIIVSDIVIVAALAAAFLFFFLRKKDRAKDY